ncbi:type II toxin-antitoxin system HigB family toxin [Alishewanella jeotgali]|uniref:Uncharacterized protein n=1 Tax=Alishewanella jeotgali KCTC 22429 TaxID=1129374 RepID=H3ZE61_9ALTE|nr:type II toxin-antitoxin system HigB family toxin [Alishewanella jeotgali]EHR41105.1 hypothetical protein AJE_08215 [Alishewanella jeotgali KCTC 22429]
MQVIRQDRLAEFIKRHAEKRTALQCWLDDAKNATWNCVDDILKDYKGAEVSGADNMTFVVGRGAVKVVAKVIFSKSMLRIDEVGLSV